MPEYCTLADVESILTPAGVRFGADRKQLGTLLAADQATYVTPAIQQAGAEIDQALFPWIEDVATARTVLPVLLKRIAAALAAEQVAMIGGQNVPASIAKHAEWGRDWLKRIFAGERVAGLEYPEDGWETEIKDFGRPMVTNP